MSNELSKVKERIRQLSKKQVSNGCTEAEANMAMNKIGELLQIYNLTMDEVDLRDMPCATAKVKSKGVSRRPVDKCILAIANFCDCLVWFNKNRKDGSSYCFFGQEADTQMAIYLFEIIDSAITHENEMFKLTNTMYLQPDAPRRTLSTSFQRGMTYRISERLNTMKEQADAMVASQRSTGTSLMLLKKATVEEEMKKTLGWLPRIRSGVRVKLHYGAKWAGEAAGERVNLSRPLANGGDAVLMIGHG